MRKLFTLLTLLVAVVTGAWAEQTSLIENIYLPDIPSTTLDMSSQTDFTPDGNGWIAFDPYNDASSKTFMSWDGKHSQSENITNVDFSSFTAPFYSKDSKTGWCRLNNGNNYKDATAVRFTGATNASFLVNPRGNRSVTVALYSYDGENQSSVESKTCANGSGFKEIIFSSLTTSTNYIAYIYTTATSNCIIAEIAIKKEVDTTPAAVSITSPASTPELVEITQGQTTTLAITATGYPAPEYQWYSNTSASIAGAEAIDGATSSSYTTSNTLAVGTHYFYCVADNESGDPATSPFFSVKVNALGADLTAHVPGVYQKASASGGYGQTLATQEIDDVTYKYEIYGMAGASSKNFWFAGTSSTTTSDAHCLSTEGFTTSFDASNITGGWMKGTATSRGTSYSTAINEFPAQAYYTSKINTSSVSFMIKVNGYDQISFLGKDNNATASQGKHFVVKINGIEQDMTLSTSYSIRRFSLDPETTNVIEICGSTTSGDNHLVGFSLRLPNTPTLSVAETPSEFNYEAGSGPSEKQTFIVTGENLSTPITATLGGTNASAFLMRTGENDYAAGPLTSLTTGTAIDVILKESLSVGDYNATLTFSSTGASDVVLNLSGSVSAVKEETTTSISGALNCDMKNGTAAGTLTASVLDESSEAVAGAVVTWSSSDESVATVDDGEITLVAPGTTTITASYAGDETHKASSAEREITVVNSKDITLAFSAPAVDYYHYDGETFVAPTLTATDGAGNPVDIADLAVVYSSDRLSDQYTKFSTINSSTGALTFNETTVGIDVVTASFAGNEDYNAAESVSYQINKLPLVRQVVFSNTFDAFIDEGENTVSASYIAGTDAPTVSSSLLADGHTASVEGNTLTVTNTETSAVKTYTIVTTAVTPFEGATKQTFDGTETYVVSAYGWDADKKWKFSKTDNNYTREAPGKTRLYIFVGAGESISLTSYGGTNRAVKVRVNGGEPTNGSGTLSNIALNDDQPNMIEIKSNQTNGDGGFKDMTLTGAKQAVSIAADKTFATFNSDNILDFSSTSDITAYTASVSDDVVTLTKVTTPIPAHTGLLLRGATTGAAAYVTIAAEASAPATNDFVAVTAEGGETVTSGYILATVSGNQGFYPVNTTSGNHVAKGKAYLATGNGARLSMVFDDEEDGGITTGINATLTNSEKSLVNSYYNLNGQKVQNPTKGLYIVNGKKVLVP